MATFFFIALGKQAVAFGFGQFAPIAGGEGEVGKRQRADAHADKAEGRMTNGGGHAADLAVFAFGEFEGKPGVGHVFADTNRGIARWKRRRCIEKLDTAGPRAMLAEQYAAGSETGECIGGRNAFHLRKIFPRVCVARIEKAVNEGAFVGKDEKALAIGVEPAGGIHARGQVEAGQRVPGRAGFGRELREDAVRFVECDEHGGGDG